MQYVLLVISVAVTLGYNLLRNRFSKHNARNQADFHSFNAPLNAAPPLIPPL